GIPPERVDVIPHAVFSFYDRFAQESEPRRDSRSLLFFGRITAYKGLEVLIRAFRKLRERHPDLVLNIVGEGDLRPYRRSLDGVPNIRIVNEWVAESETPAIFRAAEVVVVPYTSASQSGVIALAANFGCPVVATRVGAIPKQIRDGQTGLLVDPGSPEALAAAIDRLLGDDDFRQALATRLAEEAK